MRFSLNNQKNNKSIFRILSLFIIAIVMFSSLTAYSVHAATFETTEQLTDEAATSKTTEQQTNEAESQVTINRKMITLAVGKKKQLKLNGIKPHTDSVAVSGDGTVTDNETEKIKWRSSDKTVAKVSANGKVTAKAAGEAVIVAIYNDEVYTCIVKVNSKDEKQELSSTELFELCRGSMVEINVETSEGGESLGSGFFIEKNKIMTNYHVIDDASSIKIKDYNGKEYKVNKIYGYNETHDIAVLGVKQSGMPLDITRVEPVTGETVYTIGSPYGYTGTFSKGIVSLATRTMEGIDYIQITAPLSKGNSGGPLINKFGEVIGVNTLSQLEGQNINFAVKIKYIDTLGLKDGVSITKFLK